MTEAATLSSFKVFEVHPQLVEEGKTTANLARNPHLSIGVQVVGSGGDNNLHSHPGLDSIWYVLSGVAAFYEEGDRLVGKLEQNQGIFIPDGTAYWFETASAEPLVILHITAKDPSKKGGGRIDHSPRQFAVGVGGNDEGFAERPLKMIEDKYFGR